MSNNKIDRLNELNKLWFKLNKPKIGDKIKFRIGKENKTYEGEILDMIVKGNKVNYQMISKDVNLSGRPNVIITECNGIKFLESGEVNEKPDFKPL